MECEQQSLLMHETSLLKRVENATAVSGTSIDTGAASRHVACMHFGMVEVPNSRFMDQTYL